MRRWLPLVAVVVLFLALDGEAQPQGEARFQQPDLRLRGEWQLVSVEITKPAMREKRRS